MATPEFYAGHWEIKTFQKERDQLVVPVTGASLTLVQSDAPAGGIFFTMIWRRKDQPELELVGLEYKDGQVRGEGFEPQNPNVTRAVDIHQTGEKAIDADIGPWSNTNELAGIWGAEKAGPPREEPPVRGVTPVSVEA